MSTLRFFFLVWPKVIKFPQWNWHWHWHWRSMTLTLIMSRNVRARVESGWYGARTQCPCWGDLLLTTGDLRSLHSRGRTRGVSRPSAVASAIPLRWEAEGSGSPSSVHRRPQEWRNEAGGRRESAGGRTKALVTSGTTPRRRLEKAKDEKAKAMSRNRNLCRRLNWGLVCIKVENLSPQTPKIPGLLEEKWLSNDPLLWQRLIWGLVITYYLELLVWE